MKRKPDMMFSRHTAEKSTALCGKDNPVPMLTGTLEYCEVLSSVISPATFVTRRKPPLRPRAGYNSTIKGQPSPYIEENGCGLLS
ncbi:hypothetical protein TNCV_2195591 [Trichonephila clavipes]|nr:hypothetical protein TNCV_2195591 [Trichonephila clavipes]